MSNLSRFGGFLARSLKTAATCTLSVIIFNNYQIKLHEEKLLQLITARNSNDKIIARPRAGSSMILWTCEPAALTAREKALPDSVGVILLTLAGSVSRQSDRILGKISLCV